MSDSRSSEKHRVAPMPQSVRRGEDESMTTFFNSIGRRFLENLFFIVGFPIVVGLFVALSVSWSVLFVPLLAILILALLHGMQWVAWLEVKRANFFLRRKIQVVDHWFSYSFFSWAGARERLLSARSWLAVAYIFVAFLVGSLGFALSVSTLAFFLSTIGLPIGALIAWSTGNLVGDSSSDAIVAFGDPGRFIVGSLFGLPIPLTITLATLASLLATIGFGTLVWLLGKLQAHFVQGFLSNGYLPGLQRLTRQAANKLRVNEREVREAVEAATTRESLADLSPREREVLGLMAQGKSNAGIAATLFITEGSVEKHVSNILLKMNLPVDSDHHRRVLAVLEYLGVEPGVRDISQSEKT